jgi:hypothetical protein
MTWERRHIVLECGCDGNVTAKSWDDLWVGAYQLCAKHGDTAVLRMSRVYEARPSKNFSLGVDTPEGT